MGATFSLMTNHWNRRNSIKTKKVYNAKQNTDLLGVLNEAEDLLKSKQLQIKEDLIAKIDNLQKKLDTELRTNIKLALTINPDTHTQVQVNSQSVLDESLDEILLSDIIYVVHATSSSQDAMVIKLQAIIDRVSENTPVVHNLNNSLSTLIGLVYAYDNQSYLLKRILNTLEKANMPTEVHPALLKTEIIIYMAKQSRIVDTTFLQDLSSHIQKFKFTCLAAENAVSKIGLSAPHGNNFEVMLC